jgi:tRNA(Ile)-lysidine synthase
MPQKSGVLVRPLLGVSSQQTRAYCSERELAWREDETNDDRTLARNRIRLEVLPALRAVHPAVERNVLSTVDQLREESQVLEAALDEAADLAAAGSHPPAVAASRLRELPAAVRRLMLRRLAEQAAGGPLPLDLRRVEEIERLATRGGSGNLDLGAGVSVVAEYGLLRFERSVVEDDPEPAQLSVPGRCHFGDWSVLCVLEEDGALGARELGSLDEPLVDAAKLGDELTVRGWRPGDTMRPLGLGGTKSLQDLFTDRKVPRSLRSRLPVVESGGEIVWVAGVALSERFKLTDGTERAARLRASAAGRSDVEG